jgi:ribonuclease D
MISRFLPASVRRMFGGKKSAPAAAHAPSSPPAPARHAAPHRQPAAPASRPSGFHLIDHPGQLEPLLAAMRPMDDAFLDTEADNMNGYRTRLCLLQFLAGGEVFLVDALAPGLDLRPLWKALAEKNLVMHGSDYDLRLLHELCGFCARGLFDTMLAAQLLNRPRTGLAPLLEEHFGVTLDKASQRANWLRRPLTPRLLDYAALDVWHLPALRDLLAGELRALGRLGWLEQQCRRQIESAETGFPGADEFSWRIGQSERLRGAGLGVLHAVWHWRESWARKLDTPPFKVCANDRLIRLAFAAEEGASPAAILAETHLGKRHDRLAPSLAAAIRDGLAVDPKTLPRRPRAERRSATNEEIVRQDQLKAHRDRVAQRLNLDPTLIASRAQLAELARAASDPTAILLPWQAELMRETPT